MSKSERYQQIMEQTRVRFLQDAHLKMTELYTGFADYFARSSADDEYGATIAHQVHRHVHAIKGLALTLSYVQMDAVCEDILDYILKDSERRWQHTDIKFLQQHVQQLNELINQASS